MWVRCGTWLDRFLIFALLLTFFYNLEAWNRFFHLDEIPKHLDGKTVKITYKKFFLKMKGVIAIYSETCVKRPLSKRPEIGFQDQLLLNAGQKYCRMLPLEHSAILLTFVKLPFDIKIFVLSIFEWPFYTGFTVFYNGISKILASLHHWAGMLKKQDPFTMWLL